MRYQGRCHCGAVGYGYHTELAPQEWAIRACQCTFCRAHGACTTSDPHGLIEFHVGPLGRLRHYRFGHGVTDFLVCAECGVYVGATTDVSGALLAIINVNALRPRPAGLREPAPACHDGESVEERNRRRALSWSPCRDMAIDSRSCLEPARK
jgi:hypothetical protein